MSRKQKAESRMQAPGFGKQWIKDSRFHVNLRFSKSKIKEVTDYRIRIGEGFVKKHEKGIVHRDITPANIFINFSSD